MNKLIILFILLGLILALHKFQQYMDKQHELDLINKKNEISQTQVLQNNFPKNDFPKNDFLKNDSPKNDSPKYDSQNNKDQQNMLENNSLFIDEDTYGLDEMTLDNTTNIKNKKDIFSDSGSNSDSNPDTLFNNLDNMSKDSYGGHSNFEFERL